MVLDLYPTRKNIGSRNKFRPFHASYYARELMCRDIFFKIAATLTDQRGAIFLARPSYFVNKGFT